MPDPKNKYSFTFSFWIKLFGVTSSSTSPILLKFDENSYFSYDDTLNNLKLIYNNNLAYETNFSQSISKWTLISLSNFSAKEYETISGSLSKLWINNTEITPSLSWDNNTNKSEIQITKLEFGFEIIALVTNLRIYNYFINNPYDYINK